MQNDQTRESPAIALNVRGHMRDVNAEGAQFHFHCCMRSFSQPS